jgi:hypothetical protein
MRAVVNAARERDYDLAQRRVQALSQVSQALPDDVAGIVAEFADRATLERLASASASSVDSEPQLMALLESSPDNAALLQLLQQQGSKELPSGFRLP